MIKFEFSVLPTVAILKFKVSNVKTNFKFCNGIDKKSLNAKEKIEPQHVYKVNLKSNIGKWFMYLHNPDFIYMKYQMEMVIADSC